MRSVNALARALGYVWLGLLAFLIAPPGTPSALPVQIACYAVLGLALLAWTVLEASPAAAARYPAWALPVLRGRGGRFGGRSPQTAASSRETPPARGRSTRRAKCMLKLLAIPALAFRRTRAALLWRPKT